MNTSENKILAEQIGRWQDAGEYQKIVDAIQALPQQERTDQQLGQLAVAYNNLNAYDKAIQVLEQLQLQEENTCQWQYQLGYALYFSGQYQKAKDCFTRCLLIDPSNERENECLQFLQRISEELAKTEGDLQIQQEDEGEDLQLYTEEEIEAVESHIVRYFGEFPTVFHELASTDIHVDICIIPPTGQKNYYTLLTMGMGARPMNIPDELAGKKLERAELLITLPPDWNVADSDEKWYWPIRLLKNLARLPGDCNTWLGWGHTVDNQTPYAENTRLSGALLLGPVEVEDQADFCVLPNGDEVNFYQLIPLYPEEINFKISHNSGTLLDERMAEVDHVVRIDRPNTCLDVEEDNQTDLSGVLLDCVDPYLESIREKHLPVQEVTACNHLAIYLRWCIEQDLMSDLFLENFADIAADIKKYGGKTDLRTFLMDKDTLDGCLIYPYFNDKGIAFARYYYGADDEHYFPADVDDYALHYFGEDKYQSSEFQDEAYLFVPYDENYYQGMKTYLDRHYRAWCESVREESTQGDGTEQKKCE